VNSPPRLEVSGVCKAFGPTVALDNVAITVLPGEVHALIGENGAGKSTLLKVLSGAVRPDAGAIRIDGEPFAPADPMASRRAGVAMIYQELNLAPHLTVEENMALGIESRVLGIIRRSAHRRSIREALTRLRQGDMDIHRQVLRLSPAERQLVEIARALLTGSRILIMDEPTSSLGLMEIEQLFEVIRGLKQEGVSVIYVSHFLEEVKRVADRFTVLRDGKVVATGVVADTSVEQMVEHMIGGRVEEMFPRVPHEVGEPVFTVRALSGSRLPLQADITLHRGEILGLAGLVGAGRTELLRAVFGLDPIRDGAVTVLGITLQRTTPWRMLAKGVGLLSEDRKTEGLALARTLTENLTLSHLHAYARYGWVRGGMEKRSALRLLDSLSIRARGPDQLAGDLSGGNQQKLALARLLETDCDILLLDEPTRGVDVASKAQIYRLIGDLAAQGKAVLMVSSYMPELLGICDRIAVMHRGRLGEPRPASEWSEASLVLKATGGGGTA
jgi:ribose transport system ATP-binding protein